DRARRHGQVVAGFTALAAPRRIGRAPAACLMMEQLPDSFLVAAAAVLGALVGSFLNVCIYRLPRRASIVSPASACTGCERPLAWFENIPVVSFAWLRGRCRTCGRPISMRYPVVEAITSAMFALGWWYYGPGLLLVSRLVLGCALIVLFEI